MENVTEVSPRPDFRRQEWVNLNGIWDFSFEKPVFDKEIVVPFCYQSKASGINDTTDHSVVWYRKSFVCQKNTGKRLLLHFGAVDYSAEIWVNQIHIGTHKGGHTSFYMDITHAVTQGENIIVLRAEDGCETDKPRGKQSWTGETFGCWYIPTTGIWQDVWLEYVPDIYLHRVKVTPDVNSLQALCEVFISASEAAEVILSPLQTENECGITFDPVQIFCKNGYGKAILSFADIDIRRNQLLWSPEFPNLIGLKVSVVSDSGKDDVFTYFGLRDIRTEKNMILLNQMPCFQRLILNQGYWADTLMTPPDHDAVKKDLMLIKAMGFNGIRMHQKIENPYFYYWADRLGLLVWGELPSAYCFNDNAIENSTRELLEFVERDYNHPCIIIWVPINESWGVRNVLTNKQQQNYLHALLYLLKAIDPTRLVSANDGWEQISETDICAIHDYKLSAKEPEKYCDMGKILDSYAETRVLFANGSSYCGQPILLTEFGGISFRKDSDKGWGYYESAADEEDFKKRLGPVVEAIVKSGKFAGFCYTQFTDVMQEVNGLLTQDRILKLSLENLNQIFTI